mgnify:CR=1 FL=1
MENTGIKQQVIHEIQNLAQKYEVRKVILFGSRARGDFREKSDIDLAVQGGNFVHFMLDVNEETSTLLCFNIINLDEEIQSELRDSIKKEGKTIYEEI